MDRVEVVTPLVIHDLSDLPSELLQWWECIRQSNHDIIATTVLVNSHWIPIVVHKTHTIEIHTTPEGAIAWQMLSPHIPDFIAGIHAGHALPFVFRWDCGFQTLPWIMTCIQASVDEPMTMQRACSWRFLYWQKLLTQGPKMSGHIPLGGHPELETAVAAMLREHGVFPEGVMERSRAVIHSFGEQTVVQIINGPKPWQALKEKANKQVPRLRLIQEDEFSQMIKTRPKAKAVATHKQQGPNKMAAPTITISPTDVAIPEGVFRQADGAVVGQLQVRQITPNAQGVVVLTEHEFQPYKAPQKLTKEGLGTPCSTEVAELGTLLRFPVQSVASGEPILISAILVQRGGQDISRCTPPQQIQVEQIAAQTVKVLLYRDQCPLSWSQVVERPFRSMLDLIPCLKVCKQPNCTCQSWHYVEGSHEPLLDVWQRDFLSIHFKKSKAPDAALLVIFMRVAEDAYNILSRGSGGDGIYIEARTHDGMKQDPSQHTIWLQKMTYEEARAAQNKIEATSCLLRVTYRYGLRVASQDGKDIHEKFRPDEPFMASSVKTTWVVGPMPWGTTRRALIKLFGT